jgi:phosphoesterase RecJ-like protein
MNRHESFSSRAATAWQLITNAQKITLLAHQKPDPDALGACSALSLLFSSLGKKTEVIYPGAGRDSLPYTIENLQENKHTFIPDLIISCDTPVRARLYFPEGFLTIPLIVIDHHHGNTLQGAVQFVDTSITSSCELVYQLITAWGQLISPEMANQLLFGVLCDTLNFRVSGTTATALRNAAGLIDQGANIHALSQKMILHSNPEVLKLWGTLLTQVHYNTSKTALWVVCSQQLLTQYNLPDEALNGFIAMLSQTMTTDIIILFYEWQGKSKASLRSKKTNVNAIAKQLGGGGHIYASGITSDLTLVELVDKVTALCGD